MSKQDALLEIGLEDIEESDDGFIDWLIGDNGECELMVDFIIDVLPYLHNIVQGRNKTDNLEDALREYKARVITYARQEGLLEKAEEECGKPDNPNDEYDPEYREKYFKNEN